MTAVMDNPLRFFGNAMGIQLGILWKNGASLPIFTNPHIPIGQLIDSHGELPDRKTKLKLTRNPIRF